MWRVKVLSLTTRFPVTVATATPGRISTGVRDFARALDISRCSKHKHKFDAEMERKYFAGGLVCLHHLKHTKNIFTDF